MMTLTGTIPLMTSDDYRERFKAEYFQLKFRSEKLKAILDAHKAGTLLFTLTCSPGLLTRQLFIMKRYLNCLEQRARIENISLEE